MISKSTQFVSMRSTVNKDIEWILGIFIF